MSRAFVRNLYVLGAREKVRFLKDEEEWRLYDRALAVRVDIETKASEVCVEHITPLEARASGDSSVVFKCGTLQGDTLYADRKSTRLNSSHANISYAVFGLKQQND